jgi:hypothetical protein
MKKILVVLAILILIAGSAYAIDMNQSITNALGAQNSARSVVTDSSAIIKIWSPGGSAHAGIGISSSTSIIVYTDYTLQKGITISTRDTSTDTAGEIVDYINQNLATDSSVLISASIGADSRRSSSAKTLVPADIIDAGQTQAASTAIAYAQTNARISAGVEAKNGKINRLKSFTCQHPAGYSATGADGVTYTIYDGNTAIWTKYISGDAYRTSSNPANSSNTVTFPDDKGLSATKGNSLMVECVSDTASAAVNTTAKTLERISIVYDQLSE